MTSMMDIKISKLIDGRLDKIHEINRNYGHTRALTYVLFVYTKL